MGASGDGGCWQLLASVAVLDARSQLIQPGCCTVLLPTLNKHRGWRLQKSAHAKSVGRRRAQRPLARSWTPWRPASAVFACAIASALPHTPAAMARHTPALLLVVAACLLAGCASAGELRGRPPAAPHALQTLGRPPRAGAAALEGGMHACAAAPGRATRLPPLLPNPAPPPHAPSSHAPPCVVTTRLLHQSASCCRAARPTRRRALRRRRRAARPLLRASRRRSFLDRAAPLPRRTPRPWRRATEPRPRVRRARCACMRCR